MALLIAEELLLLAYAPDGSAHGRGIELDCSLAGALLVELLLGGHAELNGKVVVATGAPAPGDPRLAAAAQRVAAKTRTPRKWVTRLADGTRKRLLADLVTAGVLADEKYRQLGVLPRHRFPMLDPAPAQDATRRLYAVVLDGLHPDPRTAALASMVAAARLDRRVFPREDRGRVRARLEEIAGDDEVAAAVRTAIRAVRAATMSAMSSSVTG